MKIAFVLTLLLPVICFSQQPAKPVVQSNVNTLSIDLLNADLSSISEMIQKTNDQIKGLKDEIVVLRTQQNTLASQRQKAQFEIQQKEAKTNRSQEETAQLGQLKKEIKIIDSKMEEVNQFIKEQSDEISLLEADLLLMEEKMKELEQKEKNQQKKEQTSYKLSATDLKNDPVKLYAGIKVMQDSLPASEISKLNASQNKTLSKYNQLYNSNANFKAAVTKELKNNLHSPNTDSKDAFALLNNKNAAMLSQLKEYLDLLAALEGK